MAKNITQEQLSILIEFMERHGDISHPIENSPQSRVRCQKLWKNLVNLLDQVESGPRKSATKWVKTWTDLKHRTKKKEFLINNDRTNGDLRKHCLSDYEKRVLCIMGQRAVGSIRKKRLLSTIPSTDSHLEKVTVTFAAIEEKRLKLDEEREQRHSEIEIKRLELDILREKNSHERELLNAQIKKDYVTVQQQLVFVLKKFLDNVNNICK